MTDAIFFYFFAVLVLGLFALAARNVADPDVWWHLRTGQLIIQNHQVFHSDPYSFTRADQTWINHEWLSEVAMYGMYRLAGWGGLIVGFAAIIAVSSLLVYLRSPGRPYVAGIFTLWGAVASAPLSHLGFHAPLLLIQGTSDQYGTLAQLDEIERLAPGRGYIQVDSYRTAEERDLFLSWVLTAKTHYDPAGWKQLFAEAGYTGDYYWTIIE